MPHRSGGGMADGPQHDVEMKTLRETFRLFAIYGDTNASGQEMSGKKFAKLCKDCRVIDTKNITITDVDIAFSKVKQKSARVISFEEFLEALRQLSWKRFKEQKKDDAFQELLRLVAGKAPIVHGITKVKNVGAVSRLTDTSKYTGMHRLRFDEAGHGRGKAGREDIPDQRGYVEGYRDAGTYDQKVKGIDSPTCSKN
uniref:tubulin polymerization-promoting protein family member 3-like isoform X1 n=2 Tax=Myxine glutinosa TaxID=7769 RepID=UPI00358E77E9